MYIEFLTEYWYLFSMLLVILFLLSMDPSSRGGAGSRIINPVEVPPLQTRQHAVVVDLNDSDKFKEGHVSQSINIPFASLEDSIGKIRKHLKKPIILTCENGVNSKKAMAALKKHEFTDVYSLSGGLAAWRKEGLPLEKS